MPSSSSRIAASVSGSRRIAIAPRRSVPQPGRRSRSSGRARVSTKIGLDRPQSRRCSRKSSRPSSDHWRSSTTNATVPVSASRSKNVRHAANSSVAAAGRRLADAEQDEDPRLDPCALGLVGDVLLRASPRSPRGSRPRPRPRPGPARRRIISPSAQNVTPSPYDGERPRCHQTCSTTPSRYFSSSQASRLLPMPAWPTSETRRARRSRPVAWNCSFRKRSSSVRPTNGGSSASGRRAPPRSPTTRTARQAGTGAALPLSSCSPAALELDGGLGGQPRRLADEHAAGRRSRLEPGRGVDQVAGDHPLALGADVDGRLARSARRPGPRDRRRPPRPSAGTMSTRSRAARTARSASSSWAIGAPHIAITASPMNFSTDAAVAIDDHPGPLEVPILELAHGLRVAARRQRA